MFHHFDLETGRCFLIVRLCRTVDIFDAREQFLDVFGEILLLIFTGKFFVSFE